MRTDRGLRLESSRAAFATWAIIVDFVRQPHTHPSREEKSGFHPRGGKSFHSPPGRLSATLHTGSRLRVTATSDVPRTAQRR
jgi:hypothetical protein